MKDRYFELKNLIGAILLFSVLVWGCQKGDQTLGINLLPGIKLLDTRYHQEKTSITTAVFGDTIRVDRPYYNLLGSFNDPLFGRTDASFATQFRLPYHPAYSATSSLDSIVLRMYYKKIYGDTITPQTLQVYELAGGLDYNARYRSTFNLKSLAASQPIGTVSYIPRFRTDSLQTDTTQQVITVRLSNSFGNRLLGIDSLNMVNNDIFLNYFKGLYIESTPVSRRGTLVNILASSSMVVLYYHDAKSDTLGYAYRATANSANVSGYTHDYSQARFISSLNKNINLDTLIYVQPTGGIKSTIQVPSFSTWKDSSNYIINKATLTFHVDTIMSDYRRYPMPGRLYLILTEKSTSGEEQFPADSKFSSSYYGGFYDATTATYSFNVTQHLQQLIQGDLNNTGFYLVSSERNLSAQRVVLKGQGSSKPVELNVTYTRYK